MVKFNQRIESQYLQMLNQPSVKRELQEIKDYDLAHQVIMEMFLVVFVLVDLPRPKKNNKVVGILEWVQKLPRADTEEHKAAWDILTDRMLRAPMKDNEKTKFNYEKAMSWCEATLRNIDYKECKRVSRGSAIIHQWATSRIQVHSLMTQKIKYEKGGHDSMANEPEEANDERSIIDGIINEPYSEATQKLFEI
ncbi:hypothetical protein CYMTET_31155, partial [Cymbomonas tetramitiformis]